MIKRNRRHQLPLSFVLQLPTPHVMTASDDAGSDPFRHPCAQDEVADLCLDAHKLARLDAKLRSMRRMKPQGIGVRDLVEPLGVG